MADSKIDPFDVAALEKSLNDSATRVSTIWVSFLIFSLYLLTAATTVTHRQLFLNEPVKLVVLNIELPILGFFFLAPILFVILHAYVLIQLILLARTAATYSEALDKSVADAADNARIRQRLANALFAQLFAGSPRERTGFLGGLLRAMAWITLVIAPILILLTFQFVFLPYHSHLATWTHRILILIELAAALVLWPMVFDPRRDVAWPKMRLLPIQGFLPWFELLASSSGRWNALDGFLRRFFPLAMCVLIFVTSLSLATFPTEPHVNLVWGDSLSAAQCKRWFAHNFDRLELEGFIAIDEERLAKIESSDANRVTPMRAEFTRNLQGRDLTCARFDSADLRRIKFAGARLDGASLKFAVLRDAWLENAELPAANLSIADLQNAYLVGANLQGAILFQTHFYGAWLDGAKLQGAQLHYAYLQGASLKSADLRGATLDGAHLEGSALDNTRLLGASLRRASLQGASLQDAALHGADLTNARLDGARIIGAHVWRARNADCTNAEVREVTTKSQESTAPEDIEDFIAKTSATIPSRHAIGISAYELPIAMPPYIDRKGFAVRQMRIGMVALGGALDDTDAIAGVWNECMRLSKDVTQQEFEEKRATFLRDLLCSSQQGGKAISEGLLRNWLLTDDLSSDQFRATLARRILGQDGSECAAKQHFNRNTMGILKALALE